MWRIIGIFAIMPIHAEGKVMEARRERKRKAILEAIRAHGAPMTSVAIAADLRVGGLDMSPRTIRLYLGQLCEEGYTQAHGRKGHTVTARGLDELAASTALERVGILSARIDQMTYKMSFDLASQRGTVVVNTSLVRPSQLEACAEMVGRVYEHGYAVGTLMALAEPGERVGDMVVPAGMVGFCSVCSITLNGVLLKQGIPMHSRFGGVLELREHKAQRFVELIMYEGTSIDPLEVFIRSGMTNYVGATTTGNGLIGASFREIPGDARPLALDLAKRLERVGLGAFMEIGPPGRALYDIPVGPGRCGAVIVGGLNPISILEESGYRAESRALSGLMEYQRLFPYHELRTRLSRL